MTVSPEKIRQLCLLSRLFLNQRELREFPGELERIIAFMDKLPRSETSGSEPEGAPDGTSKLSGDILGRTLSSPEALSNALTTSKDCFSVPLVIHRPIDSGQSGRQDPPSSPQRGDKE